MKKTLNTFCNASVGLYISLYMILVGMLLAMISYLDGTTLVYIYWGGGLFLAGKILFYVMLMRTPLSEGHIHLIGFTLTLGLALAALIGGLRHEEDSWQNMLAAVLFGVTMLFFVKEPLRSKLREWKEIIAHKCFG
ncbi:hypothetical protein KA057_03350 [Candidatus Gracilibacteria bacterium]|nr:hypothetical protein [Candidatus Gracilibacteria bacterium]